MDPRNQVAREAARLIYQGKVKEYIDAKEQAAASLGRNRLPSNFEVAIELDQYAQDIEGPERYQRLIEMRETALSVMRAIWEHDPHLIGSVWRGTAHQGSDIDIILFHNNPEEIKEKIGKISTVTNSQTEVFLTNGVPRHSTHIHLKIDGYPLEVIVRPPLEKETERCEIFGDIKKGIGFQELEKLIKSDPLRKFIPKRRTK